MLVSVALPLPLFQPYTYEVPDELAERASVGSRVIVPVRGRSEMGFVVSDSAKRDGVTLKKILAAPDERPVLDAPLVDLCRWISDYYATPLGVVLRTALPAALSGVQTPIPSQRMRRIAAIRVAIPTLMERDKTFVRSRKQREVYELLESLGGRAPVELLLERMAFSPGVLKALTDRHLVEIREEVVARDPFASRSPGADPRHSPTDKQGKAIDALTRGDPGEVFLLHGVTGSGKTLVYLELLQTLVNERDKGAIVLVPEIALTPQTVSRFRAVFGDKVAVLHSALSDGERYDAWLALRSGERRIAVGARSAVFAPVRNLGAIIVDEEHETSYKQGEAPRYHAREVAIVRAQGEGAIIVLGSATPSLESWANATSGKFRLLTLPERVGGGRLPAIRVIDLRKSHEGGAGKSNRDERLVGRVLSHDLEDALQERLRTQEQAILLLNRRGYSAFVQCGDCGEVDACPNCSISLTYHRTPERLICHYCRHEEPTRDRCRRCGGAVLRQYGLGTQQVERLVGQQLPSARITRMDLDTTSGKWAHADILDRFGRGDIDILIGTQMIAKGLDFPNVTLVGVVDADVGVHLADFRASERCFQLLSQVAGRAGRGPKGGEVIIQSRDPSHHAIRFTVEHDYLGFVKHELNNRLHPLYPPSIRLANVVLSGKHEGTVLEYAIATTERLSKMLARSGIEDVTIVGPAKSPIDRIKAQWRCHFILKSQIPANLTRVCRYLAETGSAQASRHRIKLIVDRDPVALL